MKSSHPWPSKISLHARREAAFLEAQNLSLHRQIKKYEKLIKQAETKLKAYQERAEMAEAVLRHLYGNPHVLSYRDSKL